MPKISALPAMTTPVASDDQIPIHDVSAGATKRINDGELTGFPDFGWTSSSETWVYSSWSSTTRIGVVTVPTDATVKYTPGMRIRIAQTTGGTKYGIIHAVSATTLTIFFPSGTTLNNETITASMFSVVQTPFGFPRAPASWTLTLALSTQRSTASTSWATLTDALSLGIGIWSVVAKYPMTIVTGGTNRTGYLTLSTTTNSETIAELTAGLRGTQSSASGQGESTLVSSDVVLAAAATLTLLGISQNGDTSVQLNFTNMAAGFVRATSAYL